MPIDSVRQKALLCNLNILRTVFVYDLVNKSEHTDIMSCSAEYNGGDCAVASNYNLEKNLAKWSRLKQREERCV